MIQDLSIRILSDRITRLWLNPGARLHLMWLAREMHWTSDGLRLDDPISTESQAAAWACLLHATQDTDDRDLKRLSVFGQSESVFHAAAIGETVAQVNFRESPTLSKDQAERLLRHIVVWEEMFANSQSKCEMPGQQSDGDQEANNENDANETKKPARISDYEKATYILYSAAESYLIEQHQVSKPTQQQIFQILQIGDQIDLEKLGVPDSYQLPESFEAFTRAYRRGREGLSALD
jgi:hypothetical protein